MNITNLLEDEHELRRTLDAYEEDGRIAPSATAPAVAQAHLDKAAHNLSFADTLKNHEGYNDWRVTGLYYAVYHASLALVSVKGYRSKSHAATILFLIRHYRDSLDEDDYRLVDDLRLTADDAIFYNDLKERREQASYHTNTAFPDTLLAELKEQAVAYVQKCKDLLERAEKWAWLEDTLKDSKLTEEDVWELDKKIKAGVRKRLEQEGLWPSRKNSDKSGK